MRALTVVLLLSSLACSQTKSENAVVTDNTPAQSPVSITGRLKCYETAVAPQVSWNGSGTAVLTNTSKRNVMAVVATISTNCFRSSVYNQEYQHDFFFKVNGLVPSDTLSISLWEGTEGTSQASPNTIPSAVVMEVKYVQYDDGTFWGDPNSKAGMDQQRVEENAFYSQLAATNSEPDFVTSMNSPKPLTSGYAAAHPIKMAYGQSGYGSALAMVKDRLALATARYATGKF